MNMLMYRGVYVEYTVDMSRRCVVFPLFLSHRYVFPSGLIFSSLLYKSMRIMREKGNSAAACLFGALQVKHGPSATAFIINGIIYGNGEMEQYNEYMNFPLILAHRQYEYLRP